MYLCAGKKNLCLEITPAEGLTNDSAVRMNGHELVYDGFGIAVFFTLGLNAYFREKDVAIYQR